MGKVLTKDIRNIVLLGHGGCGKTSIAEAALYLTKATDRLGNPADGNTVCDFDDEEIKRGLSISTSVAPVMWNGIKINLLDAPGYLNFIGEVYQTMRVADAAMIVVDGKAGVEVGTELAWQQAEEADSINLQSDIYDKAAINTATGKTFWEEFEAAKAEAEAARAAAAAAAPAPRPNSPSKARPQTSKAPSASDRAS